MKRRWRILFALCLGWLGTAQAANIKIVDAGTLEMRQVEGGELIIIGSDVDSPDGLVHLSVDGETVKAQRIEFNRQSRVISLVGKAEYRSREGQELRGEDLMIDLATQSLSGADVLVSEGALSIRGSVVERVPGQLQAMGSVFSACVNCGQMPNDWEFVAEKLILYPGDRLVVHKTTLRLAGQPVIYLPLLVVPLAGADRTPRLSLGQNEMDGYTMALALPFSAGDHTLGTTFITGYQNRPAKLGFGLDATTYNPVLGIDKINLYFMSEPRPFEAGKPQAGRDSDFRLRAEGGLPLENAISPLQYNASLEKRDIGRHSSDLLRGTVAYNAEVRAEYPTFGARVNASGLAGYDPSTLPPQGTPFRQEATVNLRPISGGNATFDAQVTAGHYLGAPNPASPSAQKAGNNIATARLEAQHNFGYSASLWTGADFSVKNNFLGRYYGTGARVVDHRGGVWLRQNLPENSGNFRLGAEYLRREGTSPFAFDRIVGQRVQLPLRGEINLSPTFGVGISASQSYDFFLPKEDQAPFAGTVTINRRPFSAQVAVQHNFFTQTLERVSFNAAVGGNVGALPPDKNGRTPEKNPWEALEPLTLSVQGGHNERSGLEPLTVRLSAEGPTRGDNLSVYAVRDFSNSEFPLREVGYTFNAQKASDTVLGAFSFGSQGRMTLDTGAITGSNRAAWGNKLIAEERHSFNFGVPATASHTGNVDFTLGSGGGSAQSWQIRFGGPFDARRAGWTEPTLQGSYSAGTGDRRFRVTGVYRLRGLDQPRSEPAQFAVSGAWQPREWIAFAGEASYSRTRRGSYPNDVATDRLSLTPFTVGLRYEVDHTTALILTGRLNQVFIWEDGRPLGEHRLAPIVGLTLDRCCWAAQFEADLLQKAYRFNLGVAGSEFYSIIEKNQSGIGVPLFRRVYF